MTLELTDLLVSVPDGATSRVLLRDAGLKVDRGETVVLSGASGSGKSTLLAVAGLLRRPDAGRVIIGGTDVTDLDDPRRTRLRGERIGIVYQAANLLPALRAYEQVEVAAHIAGRLDAAARSRARELLQRVGLTDRLDARPGELSGGERQRVAIARALMNRPQVILADEPTASLDPERGGEVMDLLLHEASESGAATVVVTHDPEQVTHADRWLHLAHGELVADD